MPPSSQTPQSPPVPLSPERLAEIRQGQPTDWLPARWSTHQIDGDGETTQDQWQVCHGETVLATLPDWAGNLALWMANSPDDIRSLLAEIERLRARLAELEATERDPGRCLSAHPFQPRLGRRLICANCDHIKIAPCHTEAGAR